MKGALHVHSTFSDGELSLSELRDAYIGLGYQFACVTDHAEMLDAATVARYRDECRRLSDDRFLLVPGLEYECPGRIHVLGLGTTTLVETRVPQEVIDAVEHEGGISIVAHPRTQDFGVIEAIDRPATGIEAWNSKYDGRYAPRPETFAMIRRVRARHPHVRAFFGQDLHFRNQYLGLHVELRDATLDRESILAALRAGAFSARSGDVALSSDGAIDPELARQFERRHGRTRRMRRLAGRTKELLDSWGLVIPPGLKTQLRRLF